MRLDAENLETTSTFVEQPRLDWQRPAICRIDIKRTLFGVSGTSDSGSPEP